MTLIKKSYSSWANCKPFEGGPTGLTTNRRVISFHVFHKFKFHPLLPIFCWLNWFVSLLWGVTTWLSICRAKKIFFPVPILTNHPARMKYYACLTMHPVRKCQTWRQYILSSANLSPRGCVNPASWLPLASATSFKQPLREKYALQSTHN